MANCSRYYLVIEGRVKKRVSTVNLNRETVLVDLIKVADGKPFTISVVDNNVPKFVLDSKKDKQFINSLIYNEPTQIS